MERMNWKLDYAQAPLLLIWEITRACALTCQHCRASAIDQREAGELSTEEGRRLIDDVAGMGRVSRGSVCFRSGTPGSTNSR